MIVEICSRLYGLNITRFIDSRLMFRRFMIRSGRSIVFEIPFNSMMIQSQYNHNELRVWIARPVKQFVNNVLVFGE